LVAMKKQLASIAAQPLVLWLSTAGAETLAPVETGLVPAQMQLVPAEADLVPAEADQGSAEEQLVPAKADLVPAEADQGSAEEQLVPAQMKMVPAEADPVPAETQLVSIRTRPADTKRKRTPSGVTEDPGQVLPSEREAGATAADAEATRPVESAETLTSPRSHAGMPAAVGEEPREPRIAAPSPPRKRCNVAGGDGWRDQLSRRNPGLIKEFRGLPPAARLNLVRERGLCRLSLSCCDPKGGRMHKRCRFKIRIWNELCQEEPKCRQTHHRLLHVDAGGERSPQTARPAKPAEPPDKLRRSPACSRAKASREVAATQKKSQKRGSGADDGRRATTPVARCCVAWAIPVTSTTQETTQPAEAAETVAPSQAAWPDQPPGGSRVPPEGPRDQRPGREPRPPWTASPKRSEGEATRRRSGNGRLSSSRGQPENSRRLLEDVSMSRQGESRTLLTRSSRPTATSCEEPAQMFYSCA
jgi:hypothetical protein